MDSVCELVICEKEVEEGEEKEENKNCSKMTRPNDMYDKLCIPGCGATNTHLLIEMYVKTFDVVDFSTGFYDDDSFFKTEFLQRMN